MATSAALIPGVLLALVIAFGALPGLADPLAPPEAAALTTRLLDGKVWLFTPLSSVSSTATRWWSTWTSAGTRGAMRNTWLNGVDAPERTDPARWTEAKTFVEKLLPPGTDVLLVSEKLEGQVRGWTSEQRALVFPNRR